MSFRIILRIFLTACIGGFIGGIVLLSALISALSLDGEPVFDEEDIVITIVLALILFAIPGFISGLIIAALRWRLLASAATGCILYILPLMLLIVGMYWYEGAPAMDPEVFALGMSGVTAIVGGVGIFSGLACGALSPKEKVSQIYAEPPPPEHFNFR